MKRFYIIAILIISGMTAMAQDRPDITHQTTGDDRLERTTETIQLQFNNDGRIELVGGGNHYYNVNVTSGIENIWQETIGREKGNVINYDFPIIGTFLITLTSSQSTTLWRLENGVLNNGSRIPKWGEVADQMKQGYSRTYNRRN